MRNVTIKVLSIAIYKGQEFKKDLWKAVAKLRQQQEDNFIEECRVIRKAKEAKDTIESKYKKSIYVMYGNAPQQPNIYDDEITL